MAITNNDGKEYYISIEPYRKGEIIHVRNSDTALWEAREFMVTDGSCAICRNSPFPENVHIWKYHRAISKTVLCELPEEVVQTANNTIEHTQKGHAHYAPGTLYFAKEIVASKKR